MTKNHKILICVAVLALFSLTVAFAVNGGKTAEKVSSGTCSSINKCGMKVKGLCDGDKAACPKMAKKKASSSPCVKDICSDPCHLKAEGLCDGNKAACPLLTKKVAGCCKDGCDCCGGCEDGTCTCADCQCCVKAACDCCKDGTCTCEDCQCDNCCCMQ